MKTSNPILEAFARQPARRLPLEEVLFRSGSEVSSVHLLEDGAIRLERHSATGARLVMHRHGGRGIVAEGSVFSPRYGCDAIVEKPSTLRSMPKHQFIATLSTDPRLALALLEHMARGLHAARAQAELRSMRPAELRVLEHLRLLARNDLVSPDRALKENAAEIGLTDEAYYRALAKLGREGEIRRGKEGIRILRP